MALINLNLSEMPEKSVILIEEEVGSVEKIFISRIVFDALALKKKVIYLSVNSSREDVLTEMKTYSFYDESLIKEGNLRIEGFFSNLASIPEYSADCDVCIVDPFAFLILNKDSAYIIDFMTSLKKQSRKENTQFFLSMDHGITDKRNENILRSLADGIIQFKEQHVGKRIERYAYIPKLRGRIPMNEMIPLFIREDGISIDTRQAIR